MISKRFHQHWVFECPDAILTCSILKCRDKSYIVFGGHDKTLYLMSEELQILDDIAFDGWVRCSYPMDLDGDECDELLVGAGDGACSVLKLDQEKIKLISIMRYKASDKINCCIAGDVYRNGNKALIFGGEDKTLKIFKDITTKEPSITLYYDSWVTDCTLEFFNLSQINEPIYGLLVGNKNGLLQFLQIKDGNPDIIWQKNLNAQINIIKAGDITNDGYNEIVVGTDDGYVKIFNSDGKRLKYIKLEDTRPISMLIEDIDGDNSKELVIGCANGLLKVYHNVKLDSLDLQLKWKIQVSTSIKDICTIEDPGKNLRHIIFGGYDRTIRDVYDFEWGKKPKLDVPKHIIINKVPIIKSIEIEKELLKYEAIPTNLREFIVKNFEQKGLIINWELIVNDLMNIGYKRDQIIDELNLMKDQNVISYEKINFPVWNLHGEALMENDQVSSIQPIENDKDLEKELVSQKSLEMTNIGEIVLTKSLKDIIIEYLNDKRTVATKAILVKDIMEEGYIKEDIEYEINLLKENNLIQFSNSNPKGWRVVSNTNSAESSKSEIRENMSYENKKIKE